MTLALETGRSRGIILPRTEAAPSSVHIESFVTPNPYIEPIPGELLRYIAGGRGIDRRYDPKRANPYKDYENLCFKVKAQEALEAFEQGKEDAFWLGPFLTDDLAREKDFEGVRRYDITKIRVKNGKWIVDTFGEITTKEDRREGVRQKLRETNGFPVLAQVFNSKDFFARRIKHALAGAMYLPNEIYSPPNIGEDGIKVLFISPTSQEGRTIYLRPGVSHQVIEIPGEMRQALIEFEAQQKALGEARKIERAAIRQAA